MKHNIVFSLIFFFSINTYSSDLSNVSGLERKSGSSILQLFQDNFESDYSKACFESKGENCRSYYRSMQCAMNIWRFMEGINAAFDSLDGYILLIEAEGDAFLTTQLYPNKPRFNNMKCTPDRCKYWGFHAIYYNRGLVYDFDYGSRPNPVTLWTYFSTMFPIQAEKQASEANGRKSTYLVAKHEQLVIYPVAAARYFEKGQEIEGNMGLYHYFKKRVEAVPLDHIQHHVD